MGDKKDGSDSLFKSKHYFSLGEAVDEVSYSHGAKDTSLAGAKLLGKTLFNATLFAGKAGIEIAKKLPNALERQVEKNLKEDPNIEPERREKMEAFLEMRKSSKENQ